MKKKHIFWAAEKILKKLSVKNISRFNYKLFIKNNLRREKERRLNIVTKKIKKEDSRSYHHLLI